VVSGDRPQSAEIRAKHLPGRCVWLPSRDAANLLLGHLAVTFGLTGRALKAAARAWRDAVPEPRAHSPPLLGSIFGTNSASFGFFLEGLKSSDPRKPKRRIENKRHTWPGLPLTNRDYNLPSPPDFHSKELAQNLHGLIWFSGAYPEARY